MRILHISSAEQFGDGEKRLVDLARELTAAGEEVFAALSSSSEWGAKFSYLPEERIVRLRLGNGLAVFSARRLARFVRENNIEIVHAHSPPDYPAASFAVRLAPAAQLVLTRPDSFPLTRMQKFALSNASRVVAVSSAIAENLRKTFPLEKISLVPNGVELEELARADRAKMRAAFRAEHGIPAEALLIGALGALEPEKGQEDFVLAAQAIAEKQPAARFLVVGTDKSFGRSFRRRLKRLVKIFNLESRFVWLDRTDEPEQVLHALDVFVSASRAEKLPLLIPEAMAAGTAIVATATQAATELIEDNRTGRIVPVQNPARLAEAIGELIGDERRRRTLGAEAQKKALARRDAKNAAAEIQRIYRTIWERSS